MLHDPAWTGEAPQSASDRAINPLVVVGKILSDLAGSGLGGRKEQYNGGSNKHTKVSECHLHLAGALGLRMLRSNNLAAILCESNCLNGENQGRKSANRNLLLCAGGSAAFHVEYSKFTAIGEVGQTCGQLSVCVRTPGGLGAFPQHAPQPLITSQAQDIVHFMFFTPGHQRFAAETGVGPQHDLDPRPAPPSLLHDPLHFLHTPGTGILSRPPHPHTQQMNAQHILLT